MHNLNFKNLTSVQKCFIFLLLLHFGNSFLMIKSSIAISFDGSQHFMNTVLTHEINNKLILSRCAARYLQDIPLKIASYYGHFFNLKDLLTIYSSWLAFLPVLILIVSYLVLHTERKSMAILQATSLFFILLTNYFFQVLELNFAHSFFWLAISFVARPVNKINLKRIIFFYIFIGVTVMSYPVLVFAGPIAALGLYLFCYRSQQFNFKLIYIYAGLLAAMILSTYFALTFPLEASVSTALNVFDLTRANPVRTTTFFIFIAGVVTFCSHLKWTRFIILSSVACAFVAFFTGPPVLGWHVLDSRTLGTIFFSLFVLLGLYVSRDFMRIAKYNTVFLGLALSIAMVIITLNYQGRWSSFQKAVLATGHSSEGRITFSDFANRYPDFPQFCTHWNALPLTILIQYLNNNPVEFYVESARGFPDGVIDLMGISKAMVKLEDLGVKFNFKN